MSIVMSFDTLPAAAAMPRVGKRIQWAVAAAVSVLAVALTAPAFLSASAGAPADVQGIIKSVTGASASELRGAELSNGSLTVREATGTSGAALRTLVQTPSGNSTAVMAVLEKGDSQARFSGILKQGLHFEPGPAGAVSIVDTNGVAVGGVKAPWARDAQGRSLSTSYSIEGRDLVQKVNTTGAAFPVVADPSISLGTTGGVIPVWYVHFTWTETWKIKNKLDDSGTTAAATASCGLIPNGVAKSVCILVVPLMLNDIKNNVNSGIANKKCLALRLPYTPVPPFPVTVYDAYTSTCSS